MGNPGDMSNPKNRKARRRAQGPGLAWKLWRFIVDHPKGVLIGGATLLGLIVVFQNWNPTRAYLLVAPVSLPFILWALIFMLVGYLTGKWIEWGWRQRRIRKGTYKARVSPEELADAAASLEGRLEHGVEGPAPRVGPALGGATSGAGPTADIEDPATLIERRDGAAARRGAPAAPLGEGWGESRGGGVPSGKLPPGGHRPPGESSGRRPAGYSPVAEQALGGSASGRYRRDPDDRYVDYQDGGRYGDYQDTGRYVDYQDSGRYGDYQDSGHYGDYQDGGRYDDHGPDARGRRRR